MNQHRDVKPRATITKSMPLWQWEQLQRDRQPQEEKSFEDQEKELRQKVVLRYLKKKYEDELIGEKKRPTESEKLNDNLVKP